MERRHNQRVTRAVRLVAGSVSPRPVAELAWILDLLVQMASYAEPALQELDGSLLPGVAALRVRVLRRYASLWNDSTVGCPELIPTAAEGGCLTDDGLGRLMEWLSTLPGGTAPRRELLSEPLEVRRRVRRRLDRLNGDIRLRRGYRDLLAEVWQLARPAWVRRGRAVAARAAAEWTRRLAPVATWPSLVQLMPPRHPLTRDDELAGFGLFRRSRFSLAPLYFCMSGGDVVDLGHEVHVCVPASAREPVRRRRDASYVASRLRLLAEPARVHILIHLLSKQAGVMEISRALEMSQPTVSEHVRMLVSAGLVRPMLTGGRTVYEGSRHGFERVLEDARGTLARWT